MAYTTIDDPSAYFHTQLYTGNGSSGLSITNDANAGDFQADWLWIKPRSASDNNVVFDSSRGEDKQLKTNGTDAEDTHSPARVTFESDGFDLDTTDGNYNGNGTTYVAWQWKANGGTTTTNSNGNIDTTVQANTTAGFSIAQWEGANSTATLGHGLGAVPELIISKCIDTSQEWGVYHKDVGNDDYLHLNESAAEQDNAAYWNDTTPTSTVWSVGNSGPTNDNGDTMIAYVFTPIQGYSKFGSYTGNANADGPFIYTGFKPAWVLVKVITGSNRDWRIIDNKRDTYNLSTTELKPNSNAAETTSGMQLDLLSNGFKVRTSSTSCNDSETYIYMAFAEHPFVSSKGVPVTAR